MDMQQFRSQIEQSRAVNAAIKCYVGKLDVSPEDDALAWQLAKRLELKKLGRKVESCETLLDMKKIIDARYKNIVDRLEKCQNSEFPSKRFGEACALIREAIGVSIKNDDVSCLYSQCFQLGYKILEYRPKEAQDVSDNDFSQKEQAKIVAMVKPLIKDLIGFFESYDLWNDDIGRLVSPVYSMLKDAYQNDNCQGYLFKTNSVGQHTYSPDLFEELSKEVAATSYMLYNDCTPDTALGLIKVSEAFDVELVHALWIIQLPVYRKFRDANHELVQKKCDKAVKAVIDKEMKLRDIGCKDGVVVEKPSADKPQRVTGKPRKRWKSPYAGRGELFKGSGIEILGNNRNKHTEQFIIDGNIWQLTCKKGGDLLDELIKRRLSLKYKNNRAIPFTKEDRNHFKRLKCLSNPKLSVTDFFRDTNDKDNKNHLDKGVVLLIKNNHGKIVKADLNHRVWKVPEDKIE